MGALEVTIESSGLKLRGHVGMPGPGGRNLGVVLCHGFPSGARGAATAAATFPELADRVARGGWPSLAFNLRGTGASEGDFDADGWLADLRAGVRFLVLRGDVAGVCIIGFAEGGTLAVCEAADDDLVVGVAAVSAPLRMGESASHPARLLEHMRRVGMVRTPDFPPDPLAWGRSVGALDARARGGAARARGRCSCCTGPRTRSCRPRTRVRSPTAAAPTSELHEVHAAGSRLRHDPRAVATLLGWVERCSS